MRQQGVLGAAVAAALVVLVLMGVEQVRSPVYRRRGTQLQIVVALAVGERVFGAGRLPGDQGVLHEVEPGDEDKEEPEEAELVVACGGARDGM